MKVALVALDVILVTTVMDIAQVVQLALIAIGV